MPYQFHHLDWKWQSKKPVVCAWEPSSVNSNPWNLSTWWVTISIWARMWRLKWAIRPYPLSFFPQRLHWLKLWLLMVHMYYFSITEFQMHSWYCTNTYYKLVGLPYWLGSTRLTQWPDHFTWWAQVTSITCCPSPQVIIRTTSVRRPTYTKYERKNFDWNG